MRAEVVTLDEEAMSVSRGNCAEQGDLKEDVTTENVAPDKEVVQAKEIAP